MMEEAVGDDQVGDEEKEEDELQADFDDEDGHQEPDSFRELAVESNGMARVSRAPRGHFECTEDCSFSRSMPLQRNDPSASLLPPFALVRASLYDLDHSGRGGTILRRDSRRRDHLLNLVFEQHTKLLLINHMLEGSDLSEMDMESVAVDLRHQDVGVEVKMDSQVPTAIVGMEKEKLIAQLECLRKFEVFNKKTKELFYDTNFQFPIEVRLKNLTYTVPVPLGTTKIRTVYNSSVLYKLVKFFKRLRKGGASLAYRKQQPQFGEKMILDRINLILKPGRMYLVLGAPGSGKTSLLRAIASRLHQGKRKGRVEGNITYNGMTLKGATKFHIENAISFIDQLDRHAPRLTVDETFEFAFQCRAGGTHVEPEFVKTKEQRDFVNKLNRDRARVNFVLEALGLLQVRDTFVGNEAVRGVSGGQRRRVTVGEMIVQRTPILCGDEISTGLDAASTYDMVQVLLHLGRLQKMIRVLALLQPSPETVSLFDEVILLAEGKVLYAGPISNVEEYFASLGYYAPEHVDVADFLQTLSTPDAGNFFDPPADVKATRSTPYTPEELAEIFRNSDLGRKIEEDVDAPTQHVWKNRLKNSASNELELREGLEIQFFKRKYNNRILRSTWLNLKRGLILWIRDKRVIIASTAKNVIMGVSVGGVFFQTDNVVSILGVFFQATLFIMLGAMVNAPGLIDDRYIFYKQADANFYSAFPFVLGRTISQIPQTVMDVIAFGTILYWEVGLAPTAENFFVFLAILFTFNVLMNQILAIVASFASTKSVVQVLSAVLLLFFVLFCGFIVRPDAIPNYLVWFYWFNPLAWVYRALLINEFRSSDYDPDSSDSILKALGFTLHGKPFGKEWVKLTFAYTVPMLLLALVVNAVCLTFLRVSSQSTTTVQIMHNSGESEEEPADEVKVPFLPVTLTFEDICYDVKASTGNETLRLLQSVNGMFTSGRMCALMGSSGAGKTTLLDVISLRKNIGTVSGEVRLNGFMQDPVTFRRCSGYVEQFDVQSPQLTVRETVLFSARLRLDPSAVATDEEQEAFADQVLRTLELTEIADSVVGSDEEGGISFEQRKRLSIAVELAASPSIIFLDEPTSGLDARSALLVVRSLRRIVDEGRTVCATIHQPSSAVFELFDDLLLLQKGGRVVFFGELGPSSSSLIDYFESKGAPPINLGENPANWMLKVITAGDTDQDFAESYRKSSERDDLLKKLQLMKDNLNPDSKLSFSDMYAAPKSVRQALVNQRLRTIYWRSPAYNLSRLMVSLVIAFILGSVFLGHLRPEVLTESEISGLLSVIFLSFIIIGILAMISVLPVMKQIRDQHYRQRAAGMLDDQSLAWALGTAEKYFIVVASALFCIVFLPVAGLSVRIGKFVGFWGFFTFNLAIYSYFGQLFMCLVRSMPTAQILASVFIGLNNFFSGLVVRPQYQTGFFTFTYYITPGHYVYEGLVTTQFWNDDRTVIANEGSDFYQFLNCEAQNITQCQGTVAQFVDSFFGGRFKHEHKLIDGAVLAFILVTARLGTYWALKKFNYSAT